MAIKETSETVIPLYAKFADAIYRLGVQLDDSFSTIKRFVVMPIGLDGAVLYHLLFKNDGRLGDLSGGERVVIESMRQDELDNVVQLSSKSGEADDYKVGKLLEEAWQYSGTVYALDIRTKTGSLGKMLKERADRATVPLQYAVLFDPNLVADIRGSGWELSDEERDSMHWLPNPEAIRRYIWHDEGGWHYNFTHGAISNFDHVGKLKALVNSMYSDSN